MTADISQRSKALCEPWHSFSRSRCHGLLVTGYIALRSGYRCSAFNEAYICCMLDAVHATVGIVMLRTVAAILVSSQVRLQD